MKFVDFLFFKCPKMNDDRKIPRVGLPPTSLCTTPESHTITEMFKNVKFPPPPSVFFLPPPL